MDLDYNGGVNSNTSSKRVFNRLGAPPQQQQQQQQQHQSYPESSSSSSQRVCNYWRQGRCTRQHCNFLHSELPQQSNPKRSHGVVPDERSFSGQGFARRKPNNVAFTKSNQYVPSNWGRGHGGTGSGAGGFRPNATPRVPDRVCKFWMDGKCGYGDTCRFLHQWFKSDCFTMLTQLSGHEQVINAIAFPSGSDKLYSGGKDGSVRVWDCDTGKCVGVVKLGGEVGCMISEGPWIFVGLPNLVKAWNTQKNTDLSLNGPVGIVYALVVGNGMLFAGTQDGSILAWRFNETTNCFDPVASLKGHDLAVISLVVGANRLYSGSMDATVRVWDLETLQCIQTLKEHTSAVMSVLCWEQFLLTASLDRTIKVWAATESGRLEVTYTHNEDHGVLELCGVHDAQAKPVLMCSCNNNIVHLYDLPSFNERGKIFAKEEIRAIEIGPGGLFFTGDGVGELRVWKWSGAALA